jgi:general secretion pathway protein K
MNAKMPAGSMRRARSRGSALLLAMIIMALVVTLAAGMVWQHARALQVEAAERARAQSAWILNGALDWAGLILAEDARGAGGSVDHLGEVWAVPLAEARLTTFLAADRTGTVDADAVEDAPDAFLSGSITDAQARWNLRNLINADGKVDDAKREVLQRLCEAAGVASGVAQQLEEGFVAAWQGGERAPVMPVTMRDLVWLGLDRDVVTQLSTVMTLLPAATKLNLNTAPPEVIAAVLPGGTVGLGQAIAEARKRDYFRNQGSLKGLLSDPQMKVFGSDLDVKTSYFEVRGRMRLDDRVLEESSIVHRNARRVVTPVHRERINYVDTSRP